MRQSLKWLIFALALLVAYITSSATVAVTVNVKSIATIVPTNSITVRFQLQGCKGNVPRIISSVAIVQQTYDFKPNSSGIASGTIYGNDEVDCGGYNNSYYAVIYLQNGVPIQPSYLYVINASALTFDPTTATPISSVPALFPPTGDTSYLRIDAGNSGSASSVFALTNRANTFTYGITTPSAVALDIQSGADFCAKLAAVVSSVSFTGGTVDARGLTGAQTCASNPLALIGSNRLELLLGNNITISSAAAWTVPSGLSIKCPGTASDQTGSCIFKPTGATWMFQSPNTNVAVRSPVFENVTVDLQSNPAALGGFDLQGIGAARLSSPRILFGAQAFNTISALAIDGSNVLTVTIANSFQAGQSVKFYGLSHFSYLNGVTVQILTASSTQFTASYTHAADSATETGTVLTAAQIGIKFGDPHTKYAYANDIFNPWFYDPVSIANIHVGFYFAGVGNDNHVFGGAVENIGRPVLLDNLASSGGADNNSFFGVLFEGFQAHAVECQNGCRGNSFYSDRAENGTIINTVASPAAITLSRTGTTVTATIAAGHSLYTDPTFWSTYGGVITISGSTAGAFDGTFRPLTFDATTPTTKLTWTQGSGSATDSTLGLTMNRGDMFLTASTASLNNFVNFRPVTLARPFLDNSTSTNYNFQDANGNTAAKFNGTVTIGGVITSTVATGTAPFVVASTTNVANLNASSLGGATFAAPGAIGGGTPSTGAFTTLSLGTAKTTFDANGLLTKYNNLTTAGFGVPTILGITSQKAETNTADTNVLTVTPASAVGTYCAHVVISVSSATAGVISWTLSWTDSNGNAQSNIAQPLFQLGTAAPNTTFTTSSAGNYKGESCIDVNAAGAAIIVKWVGGGTSAEKVTSWIDRIN